MVGRILSRSLDASLRFLFQCQCLVCGTLCTEHLVCDACAAWQEVAPPWCDLCGVSLPTDAGMCGECVAKKRSALVSVRTQYWLDPAAQTVLHKVKYGGYFEYLDLWRPVLPPRWLPSPTAVLSVPLHPSRLAGRGFNQASLLAARLTNETPLEALVKLKVTEAQSTLSRKERLRNLRGSFAAYFRDPPPERILVVDDVYTTGSTLESCARALKQAGVREVYGWTLFRTPRQNLRSFQSVEGLFH